MNLQKIIISVLIIFLGLFFVINLTYFNKNTKKGFDGNLSVMTNSGFMEIDLIGENIKFENVEKENISYNSEKIYIDNINNINQVYFINYESGSYKKNNLDISIGKGLYLFNILNISDDFSINSNNYFKIKFRSPGKIYVDSINPDFIKIFSFDALFDIELFDNNGEKMNSLVIYPYMFIGFNPGKNKFIKNADLFKLQTLKSIFKIYYLNDEKILEKEELNNKIINSIYTIDDNLQAEFLNKIFNIFLNNETIKLSDLDNINILKENNINGYFYINKYFNFFLNNDKKLVFYQSNLINNLNKLFSKGEKKELNLIKTNILSDLNNLRNLNEEKYKQFYIILTYYYSNLIKINSFDYIDNLVVFSDILINYTKNSIKIDESIFYINKIYDLLNKGIYDKSNLKSGLITYINKALDDKNIKINENGSLIISGNIEHKYNEFIYLAFYLKNILNYGLELSNENEFENNIKIINIYFYINKYLNEPNNKLRSETLVVEYSFLLEKLLKELRKTFFKDDLDERGLLVLSSENSISNKLLTSFDFTIKQFFNFFESNQNFLTEKNFSYKDLYEKNRIIYNEYYSALNNYNDYIIEYDEIKKNYKLVGTVLEKSTNKILSKDELLKYLGEFYGLDLSNFQFEIIDNNFYKISNLYINGENFSFDLYPNNFNTIKNIYKGGIKLTQSYDLDNLNSYFAEGSNELDDKESKDKDNFKSFFLNIFFNKEIVKDTKVIEIKDDYINPNESREIMIFKRDKLLGEKGDFTLLKGFLDIGFNDVSVEFINDTYDIKINKVNLNIKITKDYKELDIMADLSRDYIFSEKGHYFKNIVLKFYEIDKILDEKKYLFEGKEFNIDQDIDILKFKDEIKKYVSDIF